LYFRDPDGNLIEVFIDQPLDQWEHIVGAVTYGAPLSL
jgi:catechol-2,3-dioxygenase